ncbi:MAG: hypothetical protein ACRDNS_05880 [Trebonia sp.]
MSEPRVSRLVRAALRCYPARWRRRHGDEAAEVAMLLIGDGTPAASIALSYLVGAAREWLTPLPGRRLSRVACGLLAATCALGVSAGLLASASPARAASPGQVTGHAHCSQGKPAMTPDPGHTRAITGGATHDRPC